MSEGGKEGYIVGRVVPDELLHEGAVGGDDPLALLHAVALLPILLIKDCGVIGDIIWKNINKKQDQSILHESEKGKKEGTSNSIKSKLLCISKNKTYLSICNIPLEAQAKSSLSGRGLRGPLGVSEGPEILEKLLHRFF